MSLRRALVTTAFITPLAALAAPNEIKVFTDELAAPGEHTLEVHGNKTSSAGPKADEARTPLQLMPEYSYGIAPDWEASLQLPFSFPEHDVRLEGYRAELQYIAPHDENTGFYWGANAELARIEKPADPAFWSAELIAILGYRTGRWHLVANPALERRLSGESKTTTYTPQAKVAYLVAGRNSLGLEYYAEAPRGSSRQEQSHMLYVAWDGKIGKSDLNVGVGRGLTDASDRWVLKMIYEIAF
jgi:hypothetical protein